MKKLRLFYRGRRDWEHFFFFWSPEEKPIMHGIPCLELIIKINKNQLKTIIRKKKDAIDLHLNQLLKSRP